MKVPIIETERLRLREHRAADFDEVHTLWRDPRVVEFIGGLPATDAEAWARLLKYAGHWTLMGYGFWVIEEKSTRQFLGECGLMEHHRDMVPSIVGTPEAGWVLDHQAWGKGYATEAVKAVLQWFGTGRVVCLVQPANAGSLRVAEKCGFIEQTRTQMKGRETVLLVRHET